MALSLLQRVADGDPAAFQQCIDCYGGLVWSLARRRCANEAEAEDAVQEIFLELWRKAPVYHPELGSEATFVAMVARRRLIDGYRRQTRRVAAEPLRDGLELAAPSAVDRVELHDEAARAAEALSTLSDAQRLVIQMSIFDGLSYPQIAERTGLPLGTVKTHARRGLLRLRELLFDDPAESAVGRPEEGDS